MPRTILVGGNMEVIFSLVMGIALAHGPVGDYEYKAVLADATTLRQLNIPIVAEDEVLNVGLSYIKPEQEAEISRVNHLMGRCGGFESLEEAKFDKGFSAFEALRDLRSAHDKEMALRFLKSSVSLSYNQEIAAAMNEVSPANLEATVKWLSVDFPTRYHRAPTNNNHVEAVKERVTEMLEASGLPFEVSLVSHNSTPQKSVRARIIGSESPNEIVVLGGHLDSILQWGNSSISAPGADDNASGSANLIEALRIVSALPQPKRSIEFFWYAGEESGLLGSGEIATAYKREGKDVVAALQLDMSLNPGAGEMVIGNTTDFTSSWLHEFLRELNRLYLNVTIKDFACGYACSDHASWFRQGYSTLMPFEATMNTINQRIHTKNDVIHAGSSFKHSAVFSKIAVGFALEIGNSDIR